MADESMKQIFSKLPNHLLVQEWLYGVGIKPFKIYLLKRKNNKGDKN